MTDTIQQGTFAGMSRAALEAYRTTLQGALIDLAAGSKAVTVSYTQVTGARSVTFVPADEARIRALLRQINAALGCGRRAVPVVFR